MNENDIPTREEIDKAFEDFKAMCRRLTAAINEAEILRGGANERPQ